MTRSDLIKLNTVKLNLTCKENIGSRSRSTLHRGCQNSARALFKRSGSDFLFQRTETAGTTPVNQGFSLYVIKFQK